MKKIIVAAIAVLIALLTVAIGVKYSNDREMNAKMASDSERMTYLIAKRNNIEKDIEKALEEYDAVTVGEEAGFVLFFDNMDKNIMTDVYPLLEEYGHCGTVVMSNYSLPGDEGLITREDYDKLIAEGWEFALGTGDTDLSGDDKLEVLKQYIDQYKEMIAGAGIEEPVTMCFNKKQYDKAFDDLLKEEGFKVIRHYGERGSKFSAGIDRNGMYYLGCGVICADTTTMKADVRAAHTNKRSYSASVRRIAAAVTDIEVDCTTGKYVQMLDYIIGYCPETVTLTAKELYNYKQETLLFHSDYLEEFYKNMSELEKSLEETNMEIEAIVNG